MLKQRGGQGSEGAGDRMGKQRQEKSAARGAAQGREWVGLNRYVSPGLVGDVHKRNFTRRLDALSPIQPSSPSVSHDPAYRYDRILFFALDSPQRVAEASSHSRQASGAILAGAHAQVNTVALEHRAT